MLHGDIQINHVVIGKWTACNVRDRAGFADYECTLELRNQKGRMEYATFILEGHQKGGGALSLAARVMTTGMNMLRPRNLAVELLEE